MLKSKMGFAEFVAMGIPHVLRQIRVKHMSC